MSKSISFFYPHLYYHPSRLERYMDAVNFAEAMTLAFAKKPVYFLKRLEEPELCLLFHPRSSSAGDANMPCIKVGSLHENESYFRGAMGNYLLKTFYVPSTEKSLEELIDFKGEYLFILRYENNWFEAGMEPDGSSVICRPLKYSIRANVVGTHHTEPSRFDPYSQSMSLDSFEELLEKDAHLIPKPALFLQ